MCWLGLIYGTTEKFLTLGVKFHLGLVLPSTIPCYHGQRILCQLRLNSTKVFSHWKDSIRPPTHTSLSQCIPLPKQKRQKISIIVSDNCFPPLAICPEVWHKLSLCIIIKKLISGCGTQNALLPDGPVGRKDDHTDFL